MGREFPHDSHTHVYIPPEFSLKDLTYPGYLPKTRTTKPVYTVEFFMMWYSWFLNGIFALASVHL